MRKYNNKLNQFLKDHRIHKSDNGKTKPTHTSLPGYYPPGKYYISEEDTVKLHKLIYEHIFVDNLPLHLTETHYNMDCSMYLDDIDLKETGVKLDEVKRKYKKVDIIRYCTLMMKHIERHFDLEPHQKLIYILEKWKPTYYKDKEIAKDGWHIVMPHLVGSYDKLHKVRQDKLNDPEIQQLFKNIGYNNKISDIIDGSVIEQNSWFMYGSNKPDSYSYYLSYIISVNELNVTEYDRDDLGLDDDRLITLFSLRNKKYNVKYLN